MNSVAFLASCKCSTPQVLLFFHPYVVLPVGIRRRLTCVLSHLFHSSAICRWSFTFRCWRRAPLLALSRYGELGFQSFGVFLAVPGLFTDCMDKTFVLLWLNAWNAWLVRIEMAVTGETVTKPVNLAQASQFRLGEMKQGARLRLLREKSLRRPARHFGRAGNSPRREGSRLSEIPRCSRPWSCALA